MAHQSASSSRNQLIRATTIGDCWLESIRAVLEHGCCHRDEDVELVELLGLAVEITEPNESDPLIKAHGDSCVTNRTLAKFSKYASMPDRPFTYGQRIYDFEGTDQFEWMVNRLKEKPETKSATIGLLQPGCESPNLPCLTTLDAKIRNGLLHLQFFFRSQNIVGRQYANLTALARLQDKLAQRCHVKVGSLRGYVASAHIYAYDKADARRLCAGDAIKITDRYYSSGPSSVRRSSI